MATGEQVKVIDAHDEHIRGLCTTKDGQFIATASLDNTIKLFQADTLQLVTTLAGHTDTVYSVVATSMYVKYVLHLGNLSEYIIPNELRSWNIRPRIRACFSFFK